MLLAFATVASDGLAVHGKRMQQHLGVAAVRFGALRLLPPMVDQRSVAVRPARQTLAAPVLTHEMFLAPAPDTAAQPRRAPRRIVPAIVHELDYNTRLAVDRTRLAYERTLMAWVRTSTSLIAFGFTIYQVFAYLERQPGVRKAVVKPGVVGIVMIVIAVVVLVLASLQHRQGLRDLRAEYGPMPPSIAGVMAVLIAGLGVLALLAIVLRT